MCVCVLNSPSAPFADISMEPCERVQRFRRVKAKLNLKDINLLTILLFSGTSHRLANEAAYLT